MIKEKVKDNRNSDDKFPKILLVCQYIYCMLALQGKLWLIRNRLEYYFS